MRNDRLTQLVLDAWRCDAGLAPSPSRPSWADTEDLGARIAQIARIAAVIHIGRAAAELRRAQEAER